MNFKLSLFCLLLALASPLAAHAAGDKGGNGGDMCEDRFKTVRDDVGAWIRKGGAAGLALPKGVTLSDYAARMQKELGAAEISCVDGVLKIGAAEKTCVNHGGGVAGRPTIECNSARFLATDQSDQYVLVHHEYAGLAGYESNQSDESQYPLSNQLTGFLEDQVEKRLVVKSAAHETYSTAVDNCGGQAPYHSLCRIWDTLRAATIGDVQRALARTGNKCVIAEMAGFSPSPFFVAVRRFRIQPGSAGAGPALPAQPAVTAPGVIWADTRAELARIPLDQPSGSLQIVHAGINGSDEYSVATFEGPDRVTESGNFATDGKDLYYEVGNANSRERMGYCYVGK